MSCPDCFTGTIHPGAPKGHVTTLHGLQTYVSEPPVPPEEVKGIVVIVPDAFGWEFVNNRLLADHYADMGSFRVYLPDFMKGTAAPFWVLETIRAVSRTGSLWDWVSKPYHIATLLFGVAPFMITNRPSKSYPLVESFFRSIRHSPEGDLPLGAAGFCWGGKHTILLAHGASTTVTNGRTGEEENKNLIDAGFTGHPSMLSLPGDIEKIAIPVSFALAELDAILKGREIEVVQKVMASKEEGVGGGGEVKVYLGAGHGFCVRADTAVEDSARQCGEAEEQAVEFFRRWFAKV
ncbi:dienelactone hydrolase family protein [Aspergillus undulatus]|uniref:dienelactone hydrolase family protein n=1 Tax=Aspergillus undulatus TaxID=1810928 RepID=UPI003CCD495F